MDYKKDTGEVKIKGLLDGKKNAVFVGESGSGKSEIAINFAINLEKRPDLEIHFFDMDQTKPLFRSRDVANQIRRAGIVFHSNTTESIEDVAAIPPGVIEILNKQGSYMIMDIGGNEHGSRMIGQFSNYLNNDNSVMFFIVNPYRPWSRDLLSINETIRMITMASRTEKIKIISNPNYGLDTTADDVAAGNDKLRDMLDGQYSISFVCALVNLCDELRGRVKEPVVPIRIHILYPWQQ